MDIILIFNGLGNQMSQYAFYLQKKYIHKNTYYMMTDSDHHGFELEKLFGIEEKRNPILYRLYCIEVDPKYRWIKTILNKIIPGGLNIIKEDRSYDYDSNNFIHQKGINFYSGGWHSEKNFVNLGDAVRQIYKFPPSDDKTFNHYKDLIENCNSVSLHIRRGDYLKKDTEWDFSGVCTNDYYQKAIDYIYQHVSSPVFYIFTDDLEYAKKNYNKEQFHIVDINRGEKSWRDMYLMTLCKHNIMANSSFSWWGAWLNKNPNKIVLHPGRFLRNYHTNDFYCDNWISIEG